MTPEYSEFLAHYGVKGQKWGTRQWQNADGTYTEAGKQHYGWGYGRQSTGTAAVSGRTTRYARSTPRTSGTQRRAQRGQADPKQQITPEEIARRKARTKKIIAIGAAVAVTAAVSYGAYKQSTKLRDSMRSDVYKNLDTDHSHLHTLNSKYWDAGDRKKYSELTAKRADQVASSINRRDAVAAKVAQKTGIKINMPQNRERVMAQRRSENEYANFIRSAEKRGHMNKQIHDARQELAKQKSDLAKFKSIARTGTSKQYEGMHIARREEQIDAAKKRLESLLLQRRAG